MTGKSHGIPVFATRRIREKMSNANLTVENEPVKKKQRFANLEASELDVLLDSAQSQNTKYNTLFTVSVYKGKFAKKMFITRKYSL